MLSTNPPPLGVTKTGNNRFFFAIYSDTNSSIKIFIYHTDTKKLLIETSLERSENIWSTELEVTPPFLYSYSTHTQQILDPYAKHLITEPSPIGAVWEETPFHWGNVYSPGRPMKSLIIYELHIKGFAKTYLGLIEKIPYLKSIGVNTIELMPCFSFEQGENYWGYAPLSFFSPMDQYSTSKEIGAPKREFQEMVKALHKNGIEVILDVVYNHVGETQSLNALAPSAYFLAKDYSGCGNTLNTNHPCTKQLILDSLHYWVQEMHVDGFRFDLASIFSRGEKGDELISPPILKAILTDPILKKTKLIAEPWDAAGSHHTGRFPLHGNRWAEWNDQFRNDTRSFLRGDPSSFIKRVAGSEDLYGEGRTPAHSINYITCHDGFSLRDLVSYNSKHNEINREDNQDGSDYNLSWNCGIEGETDDPLIRQLRIQQQKNFILALAISQGVPLIRMGDEYGHTCQGNNNPWNQDSELNWFDWEQAKNENELFRFFKLALSLRKRFPCLSEAKFLNSKELHILTRDHDPHLTFLLFRSLFVTFNPTQQTPKAALPRGTWSWIVNTANPSPGDIYDAKTTLICLENSISLKPYSAVVLTKTL